MQETAKDKSLIPGSGRSPGVGNGNPPQYSCLENSMDKGAWQATEHGVAKTRTLLNDAAHTCTHTYKHTQCVSEKGVLEQMGPPVHYD